MRTLANSCRLSPTKQLSLVLFGFVILSCGVVETHYFHDHVGQATQEQVAGRYGSPHEVAPLEGGGEAWIYYDRGSATTGYAGSAGSTYCRAYLLSFDRLGILRAWNEQRCRP